MTLTDDFTTSIIAQTKKKIKALVIIYTTGINNSYSNDSNNDKFTFYNDVYVEKI